MLEVKKKAKTLEGVHIEYQADAMWIYMIREVAIVGYTPYRMKWLDLLIFMMLLIPLVLVGITFNRTITQLLLVGLLLLTLIFRMFMNRYNIALRVSPSGKIDFYDYYFGITRCTKTLGVIRYVYPQTHFENEMVEWFHIMAELENGRTRVLLRDIRKPMPITSAEPSSSI